MHANDSGARPTVAVIGSGISGLTAAYLAQRRYDVTLFEADDRLGGHAHTHEVSGSRGAVLGLDSGFLVFNDRTYPNLIRLFDELGVATAATEMSMSISCPACGLEYAGARGSSGLFARPASLANGRYLRMLTEVPAFHRRARAVLRQAADGEDVDDLTLGEFLRAAGHSPYMVRHFALPLVSAVWSSGSADALDYPARYLFTFLANHGMLSVTGSPRWRTVAGGSRRYVERVVKGLTAVRTATPVRGVRRHTAGVEIRDDADDVHRFDHVVVATHAGQALRLLEDPTDDESSVLGAFRSSVNEATIHTDERYLPATRRAWASWNYTVPDCTGHARADRPVHVTYHLNRLQLLGEAAGDVQYLVTLGDQEPDGIRPEAVIARTVYEHPVYTRESVAAQRSLPSLTTRRTVYAGAWHGWGFHEDGCRSGVQAAASLGVTW